MLSPCCKSETKCKDTRSKNLITRRRYKCLKCNKRFSTEEKVVVIPVRKSNPKPRKPVTVKQAVPVRNERKKPMSVDDLKAMWARTA